MSVYSRDSLYKGISYLPGGVTPGTITGQTGQQFAMYYPNKPAPPGGYPLLIWFTLQVFKSSINVYSSATGTNTIGATFGIPYQWLNLGGAVAYVQVQGGDHPEAGSMRGYYKQPGRDDRAFEDLEQHQLFKDAVHVAQHFQMYPSRYNINPRQWAPGGNSAAGHLAASLALKGNQAYSLGWGEQLNKNTVPKAAYIGQVAIADWEHYDIADAGGDKVAPFLFSQDGNDATPANTISQANVDERRETVWPNWTTGSSPEHSPPIVCAVDTIATSEKYLDEQEWETALADASNIHDGWHLALLAYRFSERTNMWATFEAVDTNVAFNKVRRSPFLDVSLSSIGGDKSGATNATGGKASIAARKLFALTTSEDNPIQLPKSGIYRRTRVNTVGRFIVPHTPGRTYCRISVPSSSPSIEVATVPLGRLPIGEAGKRIGANSYYDVPGDGPIWARSVTGELNVVESTEFGGALPR